MIFLYRDWEKFCKMLDRDNIHSIPSCDVKNCKKNYLVLKHDVETNVQKAYDMSVIENRYGHQGSYYIQAYLMENKKNIEILKKMKEMGHEISYHYDVMDSNKGDINKAIIEFEHNKKIFEVCGFKLVTICQHGNPIVERIGYTSNRDFLRNSFVKNLYPCIADIMVNFKKMYNTDYDYYSDAGRKFHLIADPINNDVIPSDNKNTSIENLTELYNCIIQKTNSVIISTHPHRWTKSKVEYVISANVFNIVRIIAKLMARIPILKKLMTRFYYIAKKI